MNYLFISRLFLGFTYVLYINDDDDDDGGDDDDDIFIFAMGV